MMASIYRLVFSDIEEVNDSEEVNDIEEVMSQAAGHRILHSI